MEPRHGQRTDRSALSTPLVVAQVKCTLQQSMSERSAIRKRHFSAQYSIPRLNAALCSLPPATIAPTRQVLRDAAKRLTVLALVAPEGCAFGVANPRHSGSETHPSSY